MTTRTLEDQSTPPKTTYLIWTHQERLYHQEIGEFLSLGRDPSNQISIDDPFVSARHFRIERRDQKLILRDLRSRNGTFVNGARVVEAVLNDGDSIRLGGVEMRLSQTAPGQDSRPSMKSKSPNWQSQLGRISEIARSDYPVLITGPSGTGKDVIAQELHALSLRRRMPFVGVNCSALSESLVESELFGHVRGSFTGATNDRKGAFEAARGGTLFLDEIGDLPLSLQPKLLRALENNQIRPVGSDRDIETNVRILAATHRDLKSAVQEGRFRSDLYFRLNVVQLPVPSLLERMEDFEDIFYHIARERRVRFSVGAILALKKHSWPGNIRELKNAISRAKALFGSQEILEEHVPHLIDSFPEESGAAPRTRSIIKDIEFEMIRSRLLANRGNQRRTAQELGMAKSTLHDRIRAYGIDVEKLLEESK